jgi:hypothetical protein
MKTSPTANDRPYERVLGVYPCQTGFGFAVVEPRRGLIDWGEAELGRNVDDEFIERVVWQIRRCLPGMLAIEDWTNSLRGERTRRRTRAAVALAKRLGLATVVLSRMELRNALQLGPDATRHDVADRMCDFHPELTHQKPSRAIWKKDPRMNVFAAVALATAAICLSTA